MPKFTKLIEIAGCSTFWMAVTICSWLEGVIFLPFIVFVVAVSDFHFYATSYRLSIDSVIS